MKRILASALLLVMLFLPAIGLTNDDITYAELQAELPSMSFGDLLSLFGKVEIDPSEIPDGVSPETYETMVILEAFFDEYLEFFKKFDEANSTPEWWDMLPEFDHFQFLSVAALEVISRLGYTKLTPQENEYSEEVFERIYAILTESMGRMESMDLD